MDNSPSLLHRLVFLIVRGGAASVEVILHRRFGVKYLSGFGTFAALLMMIVFVCRPVGELGPFAIYMLTYFVFWFLGTIGAWLRFWRGDSEHSMYGGFPRLLRRSLARREYAVKQFFEPMLVGFAAYCLLDWSRTLAMYWLFAAVCLTMSTAAERRWETRDAMVLHDAALMQQRRAKRFQEIHGVRN